jgi:hypothetical protein
MMRAGSQTRLHLLAVSPTEMQESKVLSEAVQVAELLGHWSIPNFDSSPTFEISLLADH